MLTENWQTNSQIDIARCDFVANTASLPLFTCHDPLSHVASQQR